MTVYPAPLHTPFAASSARGAAALAVSAALGVAPACKPGRNAAGLIAGGTPSAADATGQAKCGVTQSAQKPLIIEWPGAERAALEGRAARGLVPVRYSGCEMEILTSCTVVDLQYEYLGLMPRTEKVTIRDFDQLYANLPVGAAKLEAKLERAGQLEVEMLIAGRLEAPPRDKYTEYDLEGVEAQCKTATHVITGITVGAFQFSSGASAEIGGGAEVAGVAGAGAKSGSAREVLSAGGDFPACAASEAGSTTAPGRCREMLRIEVVAIERMQVAPPTETDGTTTGYLPPRDDAAPTTWGPEQDRKLRTWTALAYAGAAGFVLSGVGIYAGIFVRKKGTDELTQLKTNNGGTLPVDNAGRDAAIRKFDAGGGLLWGSLVGVVGFGLLWMIGLPLSTKLKRQKQALQVAAAPLPGGITVGGRF